MEQAIIIRQILFFLNDYEEEKITRTFLVIS